MVKNCLAIFSIVLIFFGGLTGCTKTGSNYTNNGPFTYVTIMNVAYYSPSTEIYFNNKKATSAIPAGSYSSSYAPLTPSVYEVQFKAAGGDSIMADLPSSTYDSAAFNTLILYNDTTKKAAIAVKIRDDFSNISMTNSNYRFFNLCADAPKVDLYFNSSIVQAGRTVADNVLNGSYNAFQGVTPASLTVTAKVAGTDSVIATARNISLDAQNVYTLFLQGRAGSTANPITISILRASY